VFETEYVSTGQETTTRGDRLMEEKTDHELIRSAQQGDRLSFSHLVERHYTFMFKVAWQWCGVREDAEDIAQNAAIKLADHIGDFRAESAFTTWLYRLVLNTAKDYCRVKNRKNTREIFEDIEYVSTEMSAEEKMIHKDLLKAIALLPENLRETVILVCWQQLSHKEAGAILECPEGTVSWRVHEARKKIAARLGWEGKSHG
jgi:RNA polymerase sigma-70 factor (ECF subfamily)